MPGKDCLSNLSYVQLLGAFCLGYLLLYLSFDSSAEEAQLVALSSVVSHSVPAQSAATVQRATQRPVVTTHGSAKLPRPADRREQVQELPLPELGIQGKTSKAKEKAIVEVLQRNYGKVFLLTHSPATLRDDPLWSQFVAQTCPIDFEKVAQAQLKLWATIPIRLEMLDNLYCIRKHTARISIVNGRLRIASYQLSMDYDRMLSVAWLIRATILRAQDRGDPIPDVEFLLNPTDKTSGFAKGRSEALSAEPLPLFCNAACTGDESISFPMMFHAQFGAASGEMSLELYAKKHQALLEAGTLMPWDDKLARMFFTSTNFRGNRAKIFESRLTEVHALPTIVPITEYGKYKYLIYAVGHSGWSQRLRELAFMDAVVLLQNSTCHEYYTSVFEPWVDYVPVAGDLSDFEEKLQWALAHEEESKAMVTRWRTIGRDLMSLKCVASYVDQVLRQYARRQAFVPQERDTWPEFTENSDKSFFLKRIPPSVEVCEPYL